MPTCPTCGHALTVDNTKLLHHEMNEYVDSTTGKSYGIVNSKDNKIVVKNEGGTVLQTIVKKTLFKEPVATPVTVSATK